MNFRVSTSVTKVTIRDRTGFVLEPSEARKRLRNPLSVKIQSSKSIYYMTSFQNNYPGSKLHMNVEIFKLEIVNCFLNSNEAAFDLSTLKLRKVDFEIQI